MQPEQFESVKIEKVIKKAENKVLMEEKRKYTK